MRHFLAIVLLGSLSIKPANGLLGKLLDTGLIKEKTIGLKTVTLGTLGEIQKVAIDDSPVVGKTLGKTLDTAKEVVVEESDAIIAKTLDKTITADNALPHLDTLTTKLFSLKDTIFDTVGELSPFAKFKIFKIVFDLFEYVKRTAKEIEDELKKGK